MPKGPASARFIVEEESTPHQPIQWSDDGKPASDVLGRFAIFDSRCASVHVDGENQLEVVPHNLDCFEKLAQLCDRLRDRLKQECSALQMQLAGVMPRPPDKSPAALFLEKLSEKAESDLDRACNWSATEEKRLTELVGMLKDPAAEALRCDRLATSLREHADSLAAAAIALSDTKLAEISQLRHSAQGFLPTSTLLAYVTGGLAYGRVDENAALNSFPGVQGQFGAFGYTCGPTGNNCFVGGSSRTATGWTLGGGFEYVFSQNVSLKAEYLYVNLGHRDTVNVVAQSSFSAAYGIVDFNLVRGGLNFRF
jgi:hypothetical protein